MCVVCCSAQQKGMLCEEGGGSKNVKYCGYCSHHFKKVVREVIICCKCFRYVYCVSKANATQNGVCPVIYITCFLIKKPTFFVKS